MSTLTEQPDSIKNTWQNHALDETEVLPERLARSLERQTIEL